MELPLYSSPFTPSDEADTPKENNSSSLTYKAGFAMLACIACVVIYKKRQKKIKVKSAQEKELSEMNAEDPDR